MSRGLPATPFAGDDGVADPRLTVALVAGDVLAAVDALRVARVFVPVVAVAGSRAANGSAKSTDMALPQVRATDGRAVLPVFSDVTALACWSADARPVAVEGRRAALSAVAEGIELLVVDPAGASVLVRRPALWAVAQGLPWVPPWADATVASAVAPGVSAEPDVVGVALAPGRRAELALLISVRPGLDRERLDAVTARLRSAWSGSGVVAQRVDSLEVRVVAAAPDDQQTHEGPHHHNGT